MSASIVRIVGDGVAISEDQGSAPMTIEDLFLSYIAFVWRSLRHFGVADADLEDQAQEVFLVAHRRLAEWDGEQPRAWLFAIARRCAAAYRRRGHRRYERAVERLPEGIQSQDMAAHMDVDRLGRILASLDEDKRAAFILHDVEEMPMREVAAALGCQLHHVHTRLHAARQELAKALREVS